MQIAVSPYHLTTREPAAIAALLLARRVVTMLPAPFNGDRTHAEELSARIPTYLGFMNSWRWSVPLWKAGIVCSALDGDDAVDDVRAACARIAVDERYSPLRVLMKPELFETEDSYLNAVARDLLRAGPDPAITVPVAAGMDRFAIRHGLAVARSEPASVVQRAEERLGRRAFAVAAPVLLQATAERVLAAREILGAELTDLRQALAAFVEVDVPMTADDLVHAQGDLAVAARSYAAAFESSRDELLAPDDTDEVRPVEGTVAITGLVLPSDAVLTSSVDALRTIAPSLARSSDTATNLPALRDPLEGHGVLTLVIRPLGRGGRGNGRRH
jgi:hypothetical protein